MIVNEILLRRRHAVILKKGHAADPEKGMIAAMMKNVETLGFTFSRELIEILLTFDKRLLCLFYRALMPELKKLVAADKVYRPMYPGFPHQVMEAHGAELFFNALLHYWTSGMWLPEEIPFKENCAVLGKIILEKSPVKDISCIQSYFRTATDVLRLLTAMSDGDISLAQNTRFRSLKRSERRIIMDLLAKCSGLTEDLFLHRNRWIRVGEILHPGEFKDRRYEKVRRAFEILRNGPRPLFFGGRVQDALDHWNLKGAVALLEKRPGEFARRLDELLRKELDDGDNSREILLEAFEAVADQVSTRELLQVRQHFLKRGEKLPVRVFMPKGSLAHIYTAVNHLPDIEETYCRRVVDICEKALIRQYGGREKLGRVYVDEEFRNFTAPFSQRSASHTVRTLVRGSRIPLGDSAKAVRSFIWWTNCDESVQRRVQSSAGCRVDLDLSAVLLDENWKYLGHLSYTNLREADIHSSHSGDVVNGGPADGKGAAEFIDIDVNEAAGCGVRYVAFEVHSFTCQSFKDIPCRFGWMERSKVDSGEIFEPSTVKQSLEVTSDTVLVIPVILDCVEKQLIWCDLAIPGSQVRWNRGGNNLESNLRGVSAAGYAIAHMDKANLYDVIRLNAMARGELVSSREEADIVFSNKEAESEAAKLETMKPEETKTEEEKTDEKNPVRIITAYEVDYYMGQMI